MEPLVFVNTGYPVPEFRACNPCLSGTMRVRNQSDFEIGAPARL